MCSGVARIFEEGGQPPKSMEGGTTSKKTVEFPKNPKDLKIF